MASRPLNKGRFYIFIVFLSFESNTNRNHKKGKKKIKEAKKGPIYFLDELRDQIFAPTPSPMNFLHRWHENIYKKLTSGS